MKYILQNLLHLCVFTKNHFKVLVMFSIYPTSKELEAYVAFFYTINWKKEPHDKPINEFCLPSGTGILAFQSEGRFDFIFDGKSLDVPQFYFAGQQTRSYLIVTDAPKTEITGAALTPTGLWHLFNANMILQTNKVSNVGALFANALPLFKKQYLALKTPEARIEIINKFLLEKLQKSAPQLNIIDSSVNLIKGFKGCISINDLIKKLNISERYFQKKFKLMVGINPSTYTRIVRFNCLFAEMKSEGQQDYKTLSALYNYYDFAHFSKDFKKYCGEAPSNFYIEKFNFLKEIWVDSPFFYKNA